MAIALSGGSTNFTSTISASPTDNRTLTVPDVTGTINTSGGANEVPAGSASTPAIYPTGDTNTGIFFPAADTIAFAEGGVEVARMNSDSQFVASAGTASLPVYTTTGDTNTGIFFPAADTIAFTEGGVESMRITAASNVLVGGTAARSTTAGAAHIDLFNGTAPVGTLTNGVSLYSSSGDFNFMDAAGSAFKVGYRNIPQSGSDKTSSYSLATTDVGEFVGVGSGGSITIPNSTFAAGDTISIFNNTTGNITITCSITTAYIAGTNTDKDSVTLATRGVCTVLFISGTVCVLTGNVS